MVGKVTVGLAEINGSLPSGLWLSQLRGWLLRNCISSSSNARRVWDIYLYFISGLVKRYGFETLVFSSRLKKQSWFQSSSWSQTWGLVVLFQILLNWFYKAVDAWLFPISLSNMDVLCHFLTEKLQLIFYMTLTDSCRLGVGPLWSWSEYILFPRWHQYGHCTWAVILLFMLFVLCRTF